MKFYQNKKNTKNSFNGTCSNEISTPTLNSVVVLEENPGIQEVLSILKSMSLSSSLILVLVVKILRELCRLFSISIVTDPHYRLALPR